MTREVTGQAKNAAIATAPPDPLVAPPERAAVARVLFANMSEHWRERVEGILDGLGFVSGGVVRDEAATEAAVTAMDVDLVVVGRGRDDEEALSLVRWAAHEGGLVVIVTLPSPDQRFVADAAERGAFGAVVGLSSSDWESAVAIALARGGQYRGLQEAFERRAVVERAKGILMARNGIDEDVAFERLRDHARRRSLRVVDVAEAVVARQRALGAADSLLR